MPSSSISMGSCKTRLFIVIAIPPPTPLTFVTTTLHRHDFYDFNLKYMYSWGFLKSRVCDIKAECLLFRLSTNPYLQKHVSLRNLV
ncbi:hypothetical protein L2E82_16828 [Cichorium intybus]|uniref:Uncharacterized protein n=1 Tax=Cichorium intybus TaxID=13427 RepID=A0ACB9F6L9_CICIN|nr:hypothetical protein L2E82_16828 [Cichorium intybus]